MVRRERYGQIDGHRCWPRWHAPGHYLYVLRYLRAGSNGTLVPGRCAPRAGRGDYRPQIRLPAAAAATRSG
jgi:hypothetical protein